MDKKVQISLNGKTYTIDILKFIISISFTVLIVIAVIFLMWNKKIDENTNISDLNFKRYSKQILEEYEKDGKKEQFVSEYDKIQTAVGMYILNNSTLDENYFNKIWSEINEELKGDVWSKINVVKPTDWNGTFHITDQGILKFKFSSKDIEPSWVKEENMVSKITLN